jgi:hypothetical protein
MSKFLFFVDLNFKTKTKGFEVISKLSSDVLGFVKWYAPWRKYCFFTAGPDFVFDSRCLADIQNFISGLMAERKNNA